MAGKKDAIGDLNKPRLSLIPKEALWALGGALTHGETRYGKENWKLGIKISYLLDSALRHISQFNSGEDIDQQSNNYHLGNAMANLSMAIWMCQHKPDFDDRWKPESPLSPEQQEAINKSLELIKNNPVYPELIKADLEEKDCVCGEINARNCPVHQNYEQNIQEFEKFFGLDRKRFLDFSNDKGLKK